MRTPLSGWTPSDNLNICILVHGASRKTKTPRAPVCRDWGPLLPLHMPSAQAGQTRRPTYTDLHAMAFTGHTMPMNTWVLQDAY